MTAGEESAGATTGDYQRESEAKERGAGGGGAVLKCVRGLESNAFKDS